MSIKWSVRLKFMRSMKRFLFKVGATGERMNHSDESKRQSRSGLEADLLSWKEQKRSSAQSGDGADCTL